MAADAFVGLILAGGRGTRMGGADKALVRLGGLTLLDRVAGRLGPQCGGGLVLSANGDPSRFSESGLAVVADDVAGQAGPLAGILAGLDWVACNRPGCVAVVSATVDAPFLPGDLVARLSAAASPPGRIAVARSGGRDHVVHAIWPLDVGSDLRYALERGELGVGRWLAGRDVVFVDWPGGPDDPFANLNTADDLAVAERRLADAESRLAATMDRDGPGAPAQGPAIHLDLRGLKCPLPALKAAKALRGMGAGEILSILCTDPMAAIDIPNLVRQTGDVLVAGAKGPGDVLTFRIRKADSSAHLGARDKRPGP